MDTGANTMTNNSLHTITIYRLAPDVWGFDDGPNGIIAEPFVGETNHMLDVLLETHGAEGTVITFGATPFPGASEWDWQSGDEFGNWYLYRGTLGWLCPTLLVYFDRPPRKIYISAQ